MCEMKKTAVLKRIHRFALTLGLSATFVLAGLGAAWANVPETSGPVSVSGTDVLTDCGDFQVLDDFDVLITTRSFTDNDGNIVSELLNIRGTDSIYNSVTGERYTARYGQLVKVDPVSGERTHAGVVFRVNVPGAGAVLLDLGLDIFNPTTGEHTVIGGPHQLLEGDIAALCAALA